MPIGRWVLESACRQAATWRREGHDVSMPVNVSARQLERGDLVGDVKRTLRATALDPAR